jgi:hypothetical protein
MWIVGGLAGMIVLCAAGGFAVKLWSTSTPPRPATLPSTAVWLRARTPGIQFQRRGNWVVCWQDGAVDRCRVTAEKGQVEYEGDFRPVSGEMALPQAALRPAASDVITPWMWSRAAGKLVPLVPLEDGETLVPVEGYPELRRYVQRALHPELALTPDR